MLVVKPQLLFMLIQQKVGLMFKMQKIQKQVNLILFKQVVERNQMMEIIEFIHLQDQALL